MNKKLEEMYEKLEEMPSVFARAFEILNEDNWTEEEKVGYQRDVDNKNKLFDIIAAARTKGFSRGVIFALCEDKMAVEKIAKLTGLDIDVIKKLKK